jgi:hypothetical protein
MQIVKIIIKKNTLQIFREVPQAAENTFHRPDAAWR